MAKTKKITPAARVTSAPKPTKAPRTPKAKARSIEKKFLKTRPVCKVTFTLPGEAAPEAKTVCVLGEFNNWSRDANFMKRQKTGDFTVSLDLEKGRSYRFRYLIDGWKFENDWAADRYESNPYGGEDSVVEVQTAAERAQAGPPCGLGPRDAVVGEDEPVGHGPSLSGGILPASLGLTGNASGQDLEYVVPVPDQIQAQETERKEPVRALVDFFERDPERKKYLSRLVSAGGR